MMLKKREPSREHRRLAYMHTFCSIVRPKGALKCESLLAPCRQPQPKGCSKLPHSQARALC